MMIKICGITNRDDALAAVDGGASALGFNFYPPSPRYIEPERTREIAAGIPAGVLRVGVFVNESREHAAALARLAGLDVVQLHGKTAIPSDAAFAPGIESWLFANALTAGKKPHETLLRWRRGSGRLRQL